MIRFSLLSAAVSALAFSFASSAAPNPIPKAKTSHNDLYGDPLPGGVIARLGTVRFRPPGGIDEFAISPDGKKIASANDSAISLWDAATGVEIRRIIAKDEDIGCLVFSPDGKTLASGGGTFRPCRQRGSVCLWDVKTGQNVFRATVAKSDKFKSLAFSPDGQTIASGSDMHLISKTEEHAEQPGLFLWDVRTGKLLRTFEGSTQLISRVAFAPNGKTIATASADQSIRFWDCDTGRCLKAISTLGEPLLIAYAGDGKSLTARLEDDLVLWDEEKLFVIRRLRNGAGAGWTLAYSPNGKDLVSGDKVWDLSTGKRAFGPGEPVLFSPDGESLISCGPYAIRVWDRQTRRERPPFVSHDRWIERATFATDGIYIATATANEVAVWETGTGKQLWQLPVDENELRLPWDKPKDWILPHIAFSPGGNLLALAGIDAFIYFHDVKSGQVLRKLETSEKMVYVVAFAPDGKSIYSVGFDLVCAWDLDSGRLIRQMENPAKLPNEADRRLGIPLVPGESLRCSADGSLVEAKAGGFFLRIWNTRTGKEVSRLPNESSLWSPDEALPTGPIC